MANVNLLPPDLGPKASVLKVITLLKKLVTGFLLIFCFFGILTIGYIFFLNFQVKKSIANEELLKSSIRSLEQTEQKLFLIKDRLARIKTVLALEVTAKEFENIDQIVVGAASGVTLTEVEVFSGKITLAGSANSSVALGTFLDKILANPAYKTVKLTTFSYSPKFGYSFAFDALTR